MRTVYVGRDMAVTSKRRTDQMDVAEELVCYIRGQDCTHRCTAYTKKTDCEAGVSNNGRGVAFCQSGDFIIGFF